LNHEDVVSPGCSFIARPPPDQKIPCSIPGATAKYSVGCLLIGVESCPQEAEGGVSANGFISETCPNVEESLVIASVTLKMLEVLSSTLSLCRRRCPGDDRKEGKP